MTKPTIDQFTEIIEETTDRVVYRTVAGETWEMFGTCNGCGECFHGDNVPMNVSWSGIPLGLPGAVVDSRGTPPVARTTPCRPEIKTNCPSCTLHGNYLNAN